MSITMVYVRCIIIQWLSFNFLDTLFATLSLLQKKTLKTKVNDNNLALMRINSPSFVQE